MFGVFTFTLAHSLAKTIFPEGTCMGGVHKIEVEIQEGWGGGDFSGKKWKFWGGGA